MKQLAWNTHIRKGKVFVSKDELLKFVKITADNDDLFALIETMSKEAKSKMDIDFIVGSIIEDAYRIKRMLINNDLQSYELKGIFKDSDQYFA